MKKYDVIIVGAGLSGCILGFLFRKQNKKVLIIEKDDIIKKSKLCGGLLTEKSYKLLKSIYGEEINLLKFIKFEKANIICNNKKTVINNVKFYTIFRKELDDLVLKEYLKLDGEVLGGSNYSSLDTNKKELIVNAKKMQYEYLIGADGVFSKVRKDLTTKNQKMNFALESKKEERIFKELQIHFFDKFKSYGWVIPNTKNVLIGLGNVIGKTSLETEYKCYLNQLNINIDNKRGAFLPTGDDIFIEFDKNIKFIGDAAGLISPITGEGIYYAILSAVILSEDLKQYKINMKGIIKKIRLEIFYKQFVYNYKIRNYIFDRSNKILFKKIINKFARKVL